MNISQAPVYAVVPDGQLFVIHAQQMQDDGVHVMTGCAGFAFPGPLVTLAVSRSPLHPTTGKPSDERPTIVIPACLPLAERHTAKLGGPYDQGVFKHASRLQVLDQAGNRLVDLSGHVRQLGVDVGMIVPVFAGATRSTPDLDKSHPPLQHAAAKDAALGKILGVILIHSVKLSHRFAFAFHVEQVRHTELHAGGHLETLDSGFEP